MTDSISNDYEQVTGSVTNEIIEVLRKVQYDEVNCLLQELITADKIFVIAVGRVFLALQCLAKRLAHFGLDINVVGSTVEKPINRKDLLLVASGSGESMYPLSVVRIAKTYGARVAVITSAESSTIKTLSDTVVHLPCPTKNDMEAGINSIQPMSTLFDQCLHIFGDIF